MAFEKLFAELEALEAEYLDMLEEVCNIESPTLHKEGVDAAAACFIRRAEAKGWRVEVHPEPVSGSPVCITLNPDAPGAPIAFSGHLDTVHPIGLFGTPAVHRDETRMYGPGVVDCKGGAVAGMMALDALERAGFTARPVMLLLQTDEEKGSAPSELSTINWICGKAKGAAAFLNGEGHGKNKSVLQCKGIIRFRLNVHGVSVHSSLCDTGASAIAEAAHKILELEQMKDRESLTCNCGLIEGGSAPNSVAAECSFVADIRYKTEEQREEAIRAVQMAADTVHIEGTSCDVEYVSGRPPMVYAERNAALLAHMNEIYAACGMPTLIEGSGSGGTDAAYITRAGIPCVESMGTEGGRIHSAEEYMELASLVRSAKRMAAVAWGFDSIGK